MVSGVGFTGQAKLKTNEVGIETGQCKQVKHFYGVGKSRENLPAPYITDIKWRKI